MIIQSLHLTGRAVTVSKSGGFHRPAPQEQSDDREIG
jgi:hypothetical protein